MAEYRYAQGLNWRQNASAEWEWESFEGDWNPQELAPRVNAELTDLTWRENPSGDREWQSEDGSWHPEEWAPVLDHPQAPVGSSTSSEDRGIRVLSVFFAILGAVAVVAGIGLWFSGDAAYRSCQAVNSFAGAVAPAQQCTHTTAHIGMIVLLSGIGAVVLAGLIKWADLIAD
jgi:hypothetical protein